VGTAHTVTNTWEANRDILDTKTNTETAGSTIVSKFDYTSLHEVFGNGKCALKIGSQ
jgi:hypothetical protein